MRNGKKGMWMRDVFVLLVWVVLAVVAAYVTAGAVIFVRHHAEAAVCVLFGAWVLVFGWRRMESEGGGIRPGKHVLIE